MAESTFLTALKYNPTNGLLGSGPAPIPGAQQASFAAGPSDYGPVVGGGTTSPGDPGITVGATPGTPPFIPDYKKLIAGDSALIQGEADLQASDIANLAQRNAAFQRDTIDYGKLPDLNEAAARLGLDQNTLASVLTPDIGTLAQKNTDAGTSILARLNADNTKMIQQIRNTLAARGIYNSGETGYQLGQQSQAYTNSQFDAGQKLLDAMAGQQGSYLTGYEQMQIALAQLLSDAADRQYRAFPPTPGTRGNPGTKVPYSFTDPWGQPVYQGPDGTSYGADGQPYSGPPDSAFGQGAGADA